MAAGAPPPQLAECKSGSWARSAPPPSRRLLARVAPAGPAGPPTPGWTRAGPRGSPADEMGPLPSASVRARARARGSEGGQRSRLCVPTPCFPLDAASSRHPGLSSRPPGAGSLLARGAQTPRSRGRAILVRRVSAPVAGNRGEGRGHRAGGGGDWVGPFEPGWLQWDSEEGATSTLSPSRGRGPARHCRSAGTLWERLSGSSPRSSWAEVVSLGR